MIEGVGGYHVAGGLNATLFLLGLAGFVSQLRTIGRRRAHPAHHGEAPTAVLSLNYFTVSFVAYFSFFVYGYSITPFNPYLVWPRLLGLVFVLAVLYEIARDRRGISSAILAAAGTLLLLGSAGLATGQTAGTWSRGAPQALAMMATLFIAQSLVHQIVLVRREGRVGAVSWRLHAFTLAKDLSTVVFGVVMGAGPGWPLIAMGGTSVVLKLVLLAQLRSTRRLPAAAL